MQINCKDTLNSSKYTQRSTLAGLHERERYWGQLEPPSGTEMKCRRGGAGREGGPFSKPREFEFSL